MFTRILIVIISILMVAHGQFRDYTPQYKEIMARQQAELSDLVMSHPDAVSYFSPEITMIYVDNYVYDYPSILDYRLGMLIDPCRGLRYDCCLNVFGTAEYPSLRLTGLEQERVLKNLVLGTEEEVSINYDLVYEDSTLVPTDASRAADDETILDLNCDGKSLAIDGSYNGFCMGKNYAFKRSIQRPACFDNNISLNALSGCFHPDGTPDNYCLQVAYTQTAFIPLCEDGEWGDHCGTFLEIHQSEGSPYQAERDVISEVKINTREVSGYYTTVIPLNWMGDFTKVLCSYTESFIRVGSMVYILPGNPVCCCPKPFKPATRVGSFQCPLGSTGNGLLAAMPKKLGDNLAVDVVHMSFPYCPGNLNDVDTMMCSTYDFHDERHYIRPCLNVSKRILNSDKVFVPTDLPNTWSSDDIDGWEYNDVCPYFQSCALSTNAQCRFEDLYLSFIGKVGRVTSVDDRAAIPQVMVTFNDGRTSYQFSKEMVQLELTKSMYEIWWVVRSKSEFTVQKKKSFNITEPRCTFDSTNNRYFPYTILDKNPETGEITPRD
jgi:hypothetical protein